MANTRQSNKRCMLIAVSVFVVVAVVLAITIPLVVLRDDGDDAEEKENVINPSQEFSGTVPWDCYPEAEGDGSKVDEEACKSRGCNFDATAGHVTCAYSTVGYGLKVVEVTNTQRGVSVRLEQTGAAPFGGDIRSWTFYFENRGDNVARFFFETDTERYKVPKQMKTPSATGSAPLYDLRITNNESFAFQIVRRDTGKPIWDTNVGGPGSVVLSDQFLQISTRLPSTNVYGLGEQLHSSLRHDLTKTWPSFSRDQPPSWDPEANLYGVHPFYTCVEDGSGNTHGILMLNSNAQEYSFSSLPSLTFRTIGGILDFYLFLGPTPENVIQQYTEEIGRPHMPPYWALGFQLCRYGYDNIENLKAAVDTTAKYDIPHDVQYVDIDHMDRRMIFTVDNVNFPGLNNYFESLRDDGMRIIYILDPCLTSNESSYEPYNRIKQIDGYIKWPNPDEVSEDSKDESGSMLGYVWPDGKTVFPDFFKPSVQNEWKALIAEHRQKLVFDGLWIDMNEPANFGTNNDRAFNWPEEDTPWWTLKCPQDDLLEHPPYRTKVGYRWDNGQQKGNISDKTLCMTGVQGDKDQYRHYDVHSLYGWSQTHPTLEAAQEATGERSIVISRSTFPGSGQYAGHWLGDNVSSWEDLRKSIIGILEFNLFGIPYIGADICGFFDDTTPELCKRWMQLGAFYTFSRNHNTVGQKPQGPGQLGDEVGFASRDIMRVRYQLLPYLYYLFYEAATRGGTVIRPLHHEFPSDTTALSVDRQFMWGSCLLISPILEEGQTELNYYLPGATWYNYFTGEVEQGAYSSMKTVNVNKDSMPLLHLRGGCIIIEQDYASNTHYSRQNPLSIMAALDNTGQASGGFYWDDGSSQDPISTGSYYKANLAIVNNSLEFMIEHPAPVSSTWSDLAFKNAIILGVDSSIQSVSLTISNGPSSEIQSYVLDNQVLNITLPDIPMASEFQLAWK